MERRGVATVAIVSRGFEDDARASAKAFGMPDLQFVVVDRPLTNLGSEAVSAIALSIADEIARKLTEQSAPAAAPAVVSAGDWLEYDGVDQMQAWDRFQEDYLGRDWGDGFPLIPPTEGRVAGMLAGTSRDPDEVVAIFEPGMTFATVEKIAVNAVMAGCQPEHLPVLLAAVEAMSEPEFLARTVFCSTSAHAPLLIVNGPYAARIGLNSGQGALGPGRASRANTVIGRASRLIIMNVGHAYPGVLDLDTQGAPRKYGMCLAENEAASPWEPLSVEAGFRPDESTVTVFGVESELEVVDIYNTTPEGLARSFAGNAAIPAVSSTWTTFHKIDQPEHMFLLVAPDHAQVLASGRWSKQDVYRFMHENARREWKWIGNAQDSDEVREEWRDLVRDPEWLAPVARDPAYFHICVVGGAAGKSQYLPGVNVPVTKSIDRWL